MVLGWNEISDPVMEAALVMLLAKTVFYLTGRWAVVLLSLVGAGMC